MSLPRKLQFNLINLTRCVTILWKETREELEQVVDKHYLVKAASIHNNGGDQNDKEIDIMAF